MSIAIFLTACNKETEQKVVRAKNVLFISIDDLRPELGSYGNETIKTPNIDKLAAAGVQFNNAYCQQAVCVPSRSSVLTGRRPTSINTVHFETHFRVHNPDIITLPQTFKALGYKVNGVGKVFHHRDTLSWDEKVWVPEPGLVYPMYFKEKNKKKQKEVIASGTARPKDARTWWAKGKYWVPAHSWEAADVHDTIYFDGKITNRAIAYMNQNKENPFFLAVGFFRPHIPFIAPKKYFDLYPLDEIPLSLDSFPPGNVPEIALHNWGETRFYTDIPMEGEITERKKRELLRGYYASISYVDAQIGRLLKEMEKLGLAENTMVVLWGDHGYHLGDLGLWGKYSNFENATRSPLIIKVPWKGSANRVRDEIVELLDIYPTILDFSNIAIKANLEGKSLKRLWDEVPVSKEYLAFSEYTKQGYTGYSVRSEEYRYTYWRPGEGVDKEAYFELYKYKPGQTEKKNLADEPEYYKIKQVMHAQILSEYGIKDW